MVMKKFRELVESEELNEGIFGDITGSISLAMKLKKYGSKFKAPDISNMEEAKKTIQDVFSEVKGMVDSSKISAEFKRTFFQGFVKGVLENMRTSYQTSFQDIQREFDLPSEFVSIAIDAPAGRYALIDMFRD